METINVYKKNCLLNIDSSLILNQTNSPAKTQLIKTSFRSAQRKLRHLLSSPVNFVSNHEKATGAGHVGVLGEKWTLPLKYLPIGIEADGLRVVSWADRSESYYDYVKDADGLYHSAAGYKRSNEAIVRKIREMALKGNTVISLEDLQNDVLHGMISSNLPDGYRFDSSLQIIYDSRVLKLRLELSGKGYPNPKAMEQEVTNVYFDRLDGRGPLRIIHAGAIEAPTIGDYLKIQKEPYILIGGFQNVEQEEVRSRLDVSGLIGDKLISPWPTSVLKWSQNSVARHHALVSKGLPAHVLDPDQIVDGLSDLVKRMRPNAP